MSDLAWTPPPNPCEQSVTALAEAVPFGAATRPQFFIAFDRWALLRSLLCDCGGGLPPLPPKPTDPLHHTCVRSWTFVNHGAFGAALRCAQAEAEAWRRRCEAQPLLFLDRSGCTGSVVLLLCLSTCSSPLPRMLTPLHVPAYLADHRRELFAQLVRVMRELAAFVGARPHDLALLPNATTGGSGDTAAAGLLWPAGQRAV